VNQRAADTTVVEIGEDRHGHDLRRTIVMRSERDKANDLALVLRDGGRKVGEPLDIGSVRVREAEPLR
jgi:hypothetical protein